LDAGFLFFGAVLVVFGFFWLAKTMGWIAEPLSEAWLPLLVIIFGLHILAKHYSR
jgi:hypothetical protein